jgi:general secretion pathway protein M
MNLRERFEQLDAREQRLLTILGGVLAVMLILLVPLLLSAMISSKRTSNEELHAAIQSIYDARDVIAAREAERRQMRDRYARPAPPLAAFIDKIASDLGIEIPESQDMPPAPHGKKFEERSTKLTLQKIGMLNLATFMERVENGGYPVRLTQLSIRKRATETDSYDVNLVISAFDRKEQKAGAKKEGDENAEQGGEEEKEKEKE